MYDKSILAKSTGASIGVVAVVGMLFLSTGTAFAAPISGIGGFKIGADEIRGNDLVLYPGQDDAARSGNVSGPSGGNSYPQAVVELSAVEIDNLELIKRFELGYWGLNGNARLVITSTGTAQADALLLKTPQLSADSATFSGLEIDETTQPQGSQQQGLAGSIQLTAPGGISQQTASNIELGGSNTANPGLTLDNPTIRATYLATNSITLPSLALEVQFDPDNDNVYEYQ